MNQTYKITAKSPLLSRPGLEIEINVSQRYVVSACRELMNLVRDINEPEAPVTVRDTRQLLQG
mgnify:CR=1 FL=1